MKYVKCSVCGKRCSADLPVDDLTIRAFIECPECLNKSMSVGGEEFDHTRETVVESCKIGSERNSKLAEIASAKLGKYLDDTGAENIKIITIDSVIIEEFLNFWRSGLMTDKETLYMFMAFFTMIFRR